MLWRKYRIKRTTSMLSSQHTEHTTTASITLFLIWQKKKTKISFFNYILQFRYHIQCAFKQWKRISEFHPRSTQQLKFLLKCRQEGLIPNHLDRARINHIHLTNENNCIKLETVFNRSFRKILNLEIYDLNFSTYNDRRKEVTTISISN